MELKKNFYFPFIAFLIIFIALFAWLGLYNWGQVKCGEDFYFSSLVADKNFIDTQIYLLMNDNGRLLNGLLITLSVLFPLNFIYKILPLITILTYAICVWIFLGILPPPLGTVKKK